MFVKRKEFKDLQEQVAKLGREIAGKLEIKVDTGEPSCWAGYNICEPVSLKEIMERILEHFGLVVKFISAKKKKIVLRAKHGKKKQNQKETKEK